MQILSRTETPYRVAAGSHRSGMGSVLQSLIQETLGCFYVQVNVTKWLIYSLLPVLRTHSTVFQGLWVSVYPGRPFFCDLGEVVL